MKTVLFLCTGNSCRSIMAEGILNHLGKDRFHAFSAGSRPIGKVHPMSLSTLTAHGIDARGYYSKSWNDFTGVPLDIVITVCDWVADGLCPLFPGKPIKVHWGVPDPSQLQGVRTLQHKTAVAATEGFAGVYTILETRIKALVRLPIERMSRDELAEKLNEIGKL